MLTRLRERLELPLLLELHAVGGADQPLPVLARLLKQPWLSSLMPPLPDAIEQAATPSQPELPPFQFPTGTLTPQDLKRLLHPTLRRLVQEGQLIMSRQHWQLTVLGIKRVEEQLTVHLPALTPPPPLSHRLLQEQLLTLGRLLGYDSRLEQEHFDVIWREHPQAPRFSHVFEVQVSGSVDSALTRLQAAWSRFRSRPVLVVFDEASERFARARLETAFVGLLPVLQLLTGAEVARLHQTLSEQEAVLSRLGVGERHG